MLITSDDNCTINGNTTTNKLLFDTTIGGLQKAGILFNRRSSQKSRYFKSQSFISICLGAMKSLLTDVKKPLYGASDLAKLILHQKDH